MTLNKPVKINLGHSEIIMLSDGIIRVNATDQTYSIADIKDIHNGIYSLIGNQKALLLLVGSDHTLIDSDARHFLSTPESGQHSIAVAYVMKSLAQRLLLNFLIKVNGRPIPVKMFTDIDSAIIWLKTFNQAKL